MILNNTSQDNLGLTRDNYPGNYSVPSSIKQKRRPQIQQQSGPHENFQSNSANSIKTNSMIDRKAERVNVAIIIGTRHMDQFPSATISVEKGCLFHFFLDFVFRKYPDIFSGCDLVQLKGTFYGQKISLCSKLVKDYSEEAPIVIHVIPIPRMRTFNENVPQGKM
mmetsp:Transcript_24286/g.31625  ORF Transcript_24286/g.31625 Transcript_24286/m.31625 type:complete len:165 (+) Transcript_24286:81-575(+)